MNKENKTTDMKREEQVKEFNPFKGDGFMDEVATANNLMLAQGIMLIENGLMFLEWLGDTPNECSFDMLQVLKNRFEIFKDFAIDGTNASMFFLRASESYVKNCTANDIRKMEMNSLKGEIDKLSNNMRIVDSANR
jgi:hypothetical protein